jgi:hypothetical protein
MKVGFVEFSFEINLHSFCLFRPFLVRTRAAAIVSLSGRSERKVDDAITRKRVCH